MGDGTPAQTIDVLGVSVVVARADLNHPLQQGNKRWKLKHNIQAAQQKNAEVVITFGGAHSNHLLATAHAAHQAGLSVLGVVRGHELQDRPAVWSETLHQCQQLGMQLVFISRADYRLKQAAPVVQALRQAKPTAYLIPEGGSNQLAVQGVADWLQGWAAHLAEPPTHVLCPVGTGGTLAGLVKGAQAMDWRTWLGGVVVLKGMRSLAADIRRWVGPDTAQVQWELLTEFHGGGYAKLSDEMLRFGVTFSQQTGVPLDKIYNIKSFYALAQMIQAGRIGIQDRPLLIHTGGLQGGSLSPPQVPTEPE
ncbi:1-aminocyclopropane-1-carboxylate deaminase/D-cysteine desulfhydrase [Marinicella meishanensis]|uniref:1-aminocyclopropane-1-carboxylate deaminase/D-cysteine desulfhydrase n=1 Tax=Marinicella meishanensis TaxID=2873263 RepID=UPI001CBC896D|nr:pyridoxal-phosphate dependent enzyme [Marinicella sp. NBU2979]